MSHMWWTKSQFGRQRPNYGSCQSLKLHRVRSDDNTRHVGEVGYRLPGVLMVLNHWKYGNAIQCLFSTSTCPRSKSLCCYVIVVLLLLNLKQQNNPKYILKSTDVKDLKCQVGAGDGTRTQQNISGDSLPGIKKCPGMLHKGGWEGYFGPISQNCCFNWSYCQRNESVTSFLRSCVSCGILDPAVPRFYSQDQGLKAVFFPLKIGEVRQNGLRSLNRCFSQKGLVGWEIPSSTDHWSCWWRRQPERTNWFGEFWCDF